MVGRIAYICLDDSANIIIGRLIENGLEVDIIKSKLDIKGIKQFSDIKAIVVHPSKEEAVELELANYMKIGFGLKEVKIIVITNFTVREVIMKALELGANDILTDLTDSESVVKRIEDISGIKNANGNNKLYEEKDFILFSFKELVEREVKAASRGEYSLAIVYLYQLIDAGLYIDAPEDFLSSLKTIVKNSVRDTDYVFIQDKYIVLILPFANGEGCENVIERLKGTFKKHPVLKPVNSFALLEGSYAIFPNDGRVAEKLMNKVEADIKIHKNND